MDGCEDVYKESCEDRYEKQSTMLAPHIQYNRIQLLELSVSAKILKGMTAVLGGVICVNFKLLMIRPYKGSTVRTLPSFELLIRNCVRALTPTRSPI